MQENVAPVTESRTLLLVDDEQNILSSLTRLFRREGYNIITANSAAEGLEVLAGQSVGVIVSDQRMPQMTGVEFLSQVKELYPGTIRIVLSGYTELRSVTDAINKGAIYKFLTKPWEDTQLLDTVREAFENYELRAENERLARELVDANNELARMNAELERRVEFRTREIVTNTRHTSISKTLFDELPVAVIGINESGRIAACNTMATSLLEPGAALIGKELAGVMSINFPGYSGTAVAGAFLVHVNGNEYLVHSSDIDENNLKGKVMVFVSAVGNRPE